MFKPYFCKSLFLFFFCILELVIGVLIVLTFGFKDDIMVGFDSSSTKRQYVPYLIESCKALKTGMSVQNKH